MTPQPVGLPQQSIPFGEDFEFDLRPRRLRRGTRVLKLERIPLEILLLLLEHPGEIVSREQIVARVWGEGVFLDTDNSIRGAIRKIRQVLKDDSDQPRFIQTVTGRGYRFIAPVLGGGAPEVVPLPEENPPEITSKGEEKVAVAETPVVAARAGERRTRHPARWLVIAVLIVTASAVPFVVHQYRRANATPAKIASLAVLPLKNLSGDPGQDYLADGMTEELIGRLATIHNLRVISRTSVMQFRDPRQTVPAIAKILGVDAIVEGSVIRDRNRIRVHAQLIRASNDEHFWSETYDGELGDVLSLESEIAQSIAQKVEVTVSGAERARLVAARPVAPEVYENYLKGLAAEHTAKTRADVERSLGYFEEAIRKDPNLAPAYVGLGSAYSLLGSIFIGVPSDQTRPIVMSAAHKALELDPKLSDAHRLLADIEQEQWQWAESESEYRRALDLNPNDAQAHLAVAYWLECNGRSGDALAYARRARALDPAAISANDIGWLLFVSRRYEEAERELRSAVALHPDEPGALWHLGYVLIATGRPDEAIPVLEQSTRLSGRSPGVIGVLIRAYFHAGRKSEALGLLAELKRRKQAGYVPAAAFVNAYLGLGDNEQAFVWLENAYREQSNILRWVKVHPHFDPIRNDPRFVNLVHRVGLDQEIQTSF